MTIHPGTFTMGSPTNEFNRGSNEQPHTVTLTRGFEMQTTEVTQAQWVEVMGNNPSRFKNREHCPDSHQTQPVTMCPNHPVENVSHNDVQDFISRLNSQQQDGYTYRLPTEAEWEYAARAGTTTAYSFGDDASQIDNYAWIPSSGLHSHAVASLRANPWGLYDMHGNVGEWVSDWYGNYSTSSVSDPAGPSSGSFFVFRGGSWANSVDVLRSASRGSRGEPGGRYGHVGFRLVRTRL